MAVPNEIWLEILGHLDSKSRKTLRLTSRVLASLTTSLVLYRIVIDLPSEKGLCDITAPTDAVHITGTVKELTVSVEAKYADPICPFSWNRVIDLRQSESQGGIRQTYRSFFEGLDTVTAYNLGIAGDPVRQAVIRCSMQGFPRWQTLVHPATNVKTLYIADPITALTK